MAISSTDQIRNHLSRNSGVNEETMLPLARAYAQEVQQANSRLQACTNLLQRGLRSEALQQANMRPNLMDACARLVFPEFEEWLEILQFLGIELPQTLNRDAVQQLQEALVDEQPLEDLLRQHRRLAIGKAPLSWRLRVLRSIAKLDANNPVWLEDVEVWERTRLREIKTELESIVNSQNVLAAASLDEELKSPNWQIQPPNDLIKQAKGLRERIEFDGQVAELQKVAQALNDAFCETNDQRARQLRTNWQTIVKGMKKSVPLELLEMVEPAMIWLDELDQSAAEQDAHEQAASQLELVMSSSRSLPDIERAYHAATRGGFALDPLVEKRYQALTDELQLAGKRRLWMIVSAVVATCAVLIVALVLWQADRSQASDRLVATESMRKMLSENRLEDAQAFVTQINNSKPHVAQHAEFVSLVSELTGKEAAEKERVQAFATYLAEAENEDPSKIDMSAVNRAEKLARTDADKSALFRIKSRREQWEQATEQQDFQQLREELEQVKVSVDRLSNQSIDSLDEAQLKSLIDFLVGLKSKYSRAGTAGRELVDTYQTKLSSLLATHQKIVSARAIEQSSLTRIGAAASLAELKTALEESVANVPNGKYASDIKKVASEANKWHLVDRWNDMSEEAERYSKNPSAGAATSLAATINTLNKDLQGYLTTQIPGSTAKSLERAPKREALLTQVVEDFRGALLSNIVCLEASMRKGDKPVRFFSYAEHIKRQESTIARMADEATRSSKFEVVADAEGTVESRTLYPPLIVKPQPKRYMSQLLDYLTEHRDQVLNAWDSELLLQMGKTMNNAELDPSHRQLIVGRLMQAGIEGSTFLETKLKGSMKYLENQLTEPADWFHPKPLSTKLELPEEAKVRVLTPLTEAYRDRANSNAELRALGKARLTWIGMILKNGDKPIAHLKSTPGSEGDLVVVAQIAEGEPLQSVLVGKYEKGKATLKQAEPAILFGRPIFLLTH